MPHAKMMQIFSKADIDKRGELRFAEFRNSLDHMKNYLVIEIMDQLGYSVRDLGWSVTFSITILILMFAFIFVGIEKGLCPLLLLFRSHKHDPAPGRRRRRKQKPHWAEYEPAAAPGSCCW